jgi:hypothetical protein
MTARRIALLAAAATTAGLATGLTALAAPAGASTPSSAACDKAPWQAQVQGRPAGFGAGSPTGDYLWHNKTGFHLRVTHAKHDKRAYSGEVHASAPMRLERVRLEKGDRVILSHNRRTILFRFVNHGAIDGINFHTDCATKLTVSHLRVAGHGLATSHVYLGATKAHPADIPFTVHRTPTPTT